MVDPLQAPIAVPVLRLLDPGQPQVDGGEGLRAAAEGLDRLAFRLALAMAEHRLQTDLLAVVRERRRSPRSGAAAGPRAQRRWDADLREMAGRHGSVDRPATVAKAAARPGRPHQDGRPARARLHLAVVQGNRDSRRVASPLAYLAAAARRAFGFRLGVGLRHGRPVPAEPATAEPGGEAGECRGSSHRQAVFRRGRRRSRRQRRDWNRPGRNGSGHGGLGVGSRRRPRPTGIPSTLLLRRLSGGCGTAGASISMGSAAMAIAARRRGTCRGSSIAIAVFRRRGQPRRQRPPRQRFQRQRGVRRRLPGWAQAGCSRRPRDPPSGSISNRQPARRALPKA